MTTRCTEFVKISWLASTRDTDANKALKICNQINNFYSSSKVRNRTAVINL